MTVENALNFVGGKAKYLAETKFRFVEREITGQVSGENNPIELFRFSHRELVFFEPQL